MQLNSTVSVRRQQRIRERATVLVTHALPVWFITVFNASCDRFGMVHVLNRKGKGKGHPITGHEDPEGK